MKLIFLNKWYKDLFGIIQYFLVSCLLFLQNEIRRITDPQECRANMTPYSVYMGKYVIQTFDKQLYKWYPTATMYSCRQWKLKIFNWITESSIQYFYYKAAKDFKDFFYVYNLTRDCQSRVQWLLKKNDQINTLSKGVVIKIGIAGRFTVDNLNLISKHRGKVLNISTTTK